jgi:SAM-dependent methyltransferase
MKKVEEYYSDKITRFGPIPAGADWNSRESQYIRFNQLSKIIDQPASFSILDYGCGYGELYTYLSNKYNNFKYTGFDISPQMIEAAKAKNELIKDNFTNNFENIEKSDYVIASGVFSVKLDTPAEEWKQYVLDNLQKINDLNESAFSFNITTIYSDKEHMRDHLFYADPLFFFDYCKKNFSKYVAVLHDYPLYEFTILVRKKV